MRNLRWFLPRKNRKPVVFVCVGLLCFYQIFISTSTSSAVRGAEYRDLFIDESIADSVENIQVQLKARTVTRRRDCILPKSYGRLQQQMETDMHWAWVAERVEHNWEYVYRATQRLMTEGKLANRTCLYILVLPGLLTQTNFAKQAFEGGPLGELLQWADLVTALHALGHHVVLRYDLQYAALDLRMAAMENPSTNNTGCTEGPYDIIFTDLGGHSKLPPEVKERYRKRLRIIDTYGTEVQYNYQDYAYRHSLERSAGKRELYIKHFYTMYPETVDNSFLGFMVHPSVSSVPKEQIAILYGKDPLYVQRKRNFINSLRDFVELHATFPSHPILEALPGVINHGVMRSMEYRNIAQKSKYFIGLGNPIEGPGMIEALSRGCIIFQPRFDPPLSLDSLGKPCNRTLHSQVPYLDRIGRPNVFTFQYNDPFQLAEVFKTTANMKVKLRLPYEFTAEAFIERVETTLTKYDFCTKRPKLNRNTKHKVKTVLSTQGDLSCTQVCNKRGLVCDVTAFSNLNRVNYLQRLTNCTTYRSEEEVFAPALQGGTCILQGDTRLYSCASYTTIRDNRVYRVCPCVQCDHTNQHFCGITP